MVASVLGRAPNAGDTKLAAAALSMTASLDEDVVDFSPNYDGRETEPAVLPAAIPNLLVNGAAGIDDRAKTEIKKRTRGQYRAAHNSFLWLK